jgi:hypothetical protein
VIAVGSDQDQAQALPREVWTARYEDLRRQVVEEHRGLGQGGGLALFVRQGLVAWMQAWPEQVGPWPPCAESGDCGQMSPVEPIRLCTSLRHQLARVLVTMVLNHQETPIAMASSRRR